MFKIKLESVLDKNLKIWLLLNKAANNYLKLLLLLLLLLLHNVYIFSVCYLTKYVTAVVDKIKINEVFSCSVDIIITYKHETIWFNQVDSE